MKNLIKSTMAVVIIAASAATSQAASNTGELILGFTVGSGNDVEYSLGTALSLVNGETWNLSSLLGAQNLNVAGVKWGVVGAAIESGVRTSYETKAVGVPALLNGVTAYNSVNAGVGTITSLFGSLTEGTTIAPSSTLSSSWNKQTAIGGTYRTAAGDPNTAGYTSVNFYKTIANNTAPALFGTFSFANDGIVTFSAVAVPEPGVYGVLAGAGLLIVSLRKKLTRAQA